MPDGFKKITNTKFFHIAIIMTIIVLIVFISGVIILKYNVEGETNMPFDLTKISIISTVEGIQKTQQENRWAYNINQNNDIYLYIGKNNDYSKEEKIKSINIQNINIESKNKEKIKIYKPNNEKENSTFNNTQEYEVNNLEYLVSVQTDIKESKISNQGGLVAFRCAINNVAEYISNEEEEIKNDQLLKKANVKEEDLQTKLTFDLLIKIEQGNQYKSTITLDLPLKNVVEEGTTAKEITNLKEFIFKRI